MNGMGLTPLLCAVRNHGVLEEESQSLINNIPTIQALLRFNADPLIPVRKIPGQPNVDELV